MNDELANSLEPLWVSMNAEVENSLGRSFRDSDSQMKVWVCLKAGCLERMPQIVGNSRLRAHPAF